MSDLEKWWTPKFVSLYCDKRLRNQSSQNFNFTTPMVWREPTNHLDHGLPTFFPLPPTFLS